MKYYKLGVVLLVGMVMVLLLAACSNSAPVQETLTQQSVSNCLGFGMAAPRGGVGAIIVGGSNICKYSGGVVWETPIGIGVGFPIAVAVTNTGISYVAGRVGDISTPGDVFVKKFAANGVAQWTKQYGTASPDEARDVTVDSSGNVYVLSLENHLFVRVRRFNPSGTLLLTITATAASANAINPIAIQVDRNGNIFVLTSYLTSSGKRVARLYKYNSAGILLASPDVFVGVGPGNVTPRDLAVGNSNNLYVLVTDNNLFRGAYLRKVNNDGVTLWTANLEPEIGTKGVDSVPSSLALDTHGNAYVRGSTFGAYPGFPKGGTFAMKLSATTGTRLWVKQYDDGGGPGIAVSDAVYAVIPGTNGEAALAQLDLATGAILSIEQ